MMSTVLYFAQCAAEISLLGGIEAASVALIIYYIFSRTRAPAIIANLFPNLNLSYRTSLNKFNNISNELLYTLRSTNNNENPDETKPQITLAHGIGTQNMLQVTPHAGRKPFKSLFDWGLLFPYLAQTVRTKKFDYPQVSGLVHNDPLFKRAIRTAAEQLFREKRYENNGHRVLTRSISDVETIIDTDEDVGTYQNILTSQEQRAVNILDNMRSTLSNFLLAFTSWLLYKLLPCFLTGVVTHTKQIEMLKAASQRAPGTPLIFVPLHRSHLDYIMVTFILTNNDIRSPLVAAGNNLQIPVFGNLLRGLGAFFIKRKIDPVEGKKDVLYRAALQLYIQHALKSGHNVEFFIEGGRTRTGKPCMPKGGILSVIVNAFMDNSISDALLVPVSVNYERLVDGNFVREQKGEKKEPESFVKAISGIWKALCSNYGLMRIDFNEPYSIRELVQSYSKIAKEDGIIKTYKPSARTLQHNQSTSSLYGTDVVCEEQRNLIESISRQVVFDCGVATSVMSTNALAFLFLTRYRKGAEEHEIALGLDELRNTLKGRKDMGFSGESGQIIKYACDLLGKDLITRTKQENGSWFICPVSTIESLIELSYYANVLAPHFALESIVLTTFHGLLPKPSTKDEAPGVCRKILIDKALENCQVFRYEFILHKPTQVLENMLERALDNLFLDGYLKLAEQSSLDSEANAESRRIARNIAQCLDEVDECESDDEYVNTEKLQKPNVFLNLETVQKQRYICEVLAPFSSTYLSVAQHLQILHNCAMLETEFIRTIINDLSDRVKNNTCLYAESISTDSVRNCLKLLEKWSVIEVCSQGGMRVISLSTLYETAKDMLKSVVQRIAVTVPNYENGYFLK